MMRVESLLVSSCPGLKLVIDALVGLLGQSVELSNGVVESLLGEVARSVGAVEDLVADGLAPKIAFK
jgi:hypothetical protein